MPPLAPSRGLWSYTGYINPTDTVNYRPIDQVRYLVQDTDHLVPLLSDSEIAYEIYEWIGTYEPSGMDGVPGLWQNGAYDHPLMAAHGCALRVSSQLTGVPSVSADGVAVNTGDLQARYATLADALKDEYERISQTGGDIDLDNLLVGLVRDPSIRPTTFGIGMNDNPLAGQQDYGGLQDWPAGYYELDADDVEVP